MIWTHKVKFNWLHLLALYKDLSDQFQLEAIIEVLLLLGQGSFNGALKKFQFFSLHLITNYNVNIINYTV